MMTGDSLATNACDLEAVAICAQADRKPTPVVYVRLDPLMIYLESVEPLAVFANHVSEAVAASFWFSVSTIRPLSLDVSSGSILQAAQRATTTF